MQTIAKSRAAQDKMLNHARWLILLAVGMITLAFGWVRWHSAPSISKATEDFFATSIQRTGAATDDLIEALQTRLQAAPDDWQAYSQLGLAYLQKARETGDPTYYARIEEAFNQALSREPTDYAAIAGMGTLQLARHQFASALEWGQRAHQINPARTYAYGVIADAQVELGRYPEAVQTLQTMADLRPDANSYTRISYLRELYGDTEGALAMMQQAVESSGHSPETMAWMQTQLANLYLNQGNLAQAELEYGRALAIMPDYVYALGGLAHVRAAQGHTDGAIKLLTQAIPINPLPEFVILLGDIYQATGQTEAAQTQFDLVRTIEKLYQANGVDLDMEIALFNADHDLDSAATLTLAREAYARRPSIYAADVLAWVLYKAGHYDEAQSYAGQALRLGTKDALKLFHAGMIAQALSDVTMARTYLQHALEINPTFSVRYAPEAQQLLAELD